MVRFDSAYNCLPGIRVHVLTHFSKTSPILPYCLVSTIDDDGNILHFYESLIHEMKTKTTTVIFRTIAIQTQSKCEGKERV